MPENQKGDAFTLSEFLSDWMNTYVETFVEEPASVEDLAEDVATLFGLNEKSLVKPAEKPPLKLPEE